MADDSGQASAEREPPEPPDARLPRRDNATPRRRPGQLRALIVGLIGLIAGIAIPLAPVITRDVVVSWPQQGQPPESTLAFFVPYEPTELHVQVPCSVIHTAGQRVDPTTVVSSHLPGGASKGFAVTTGDNHVLVLAGGAELLRAPIAGNCSINLDSDASGSTVRIGDQVVTDPQRNVEEINAFATDLAPNAAEGIRVTATTANWFENSPTLGKKVLMVIQLLAAALAFILLIRTDWRRATGPLVRPRLRRPGLRGLVDLAVCAALGEWLLLGPTSPDDSFAAMTVRNGLRTGDIGNYYRWENASESPFTLVQHLLMQVAEVNISPLAMRVPSVIAALLTWLLLSRGVLRVVLPTHSRRIAVRGLAALCFLAWWLPFGLGVRPEAFAALGLTAVLAFLLLAVDRGHLFWLGLAALAGGLMIAVNSMAVAVLAPVIVLGPRLWRLVRGRGQTARLALLGCIGATGLVAIFADQSLFGVREATRLHRYYGPDVPWFQEIQRYEYLLGFNLEGDIGRRTPVLLTITLLIFCALLLSRGARRLPGMTYAHVPPACMAISLVLLWWTPSKWTHYFGALAGVGAATLTAGVMLILIVARQWAEYRIVPLLGLLGTASSVIAAALAFAGKNNWFFYSHFGVPWGEQPVRPLNSPVPWLLLVGVVLTISALRTAARTNNSDQPVRRMLIRMPVVISALAMGVTVTILLSSFIVAPISRGDGYTPGAQNITSLVGRGCGIADHIVVTPEVPDGSLRQANGTETLTGFTRGTGFPVPGPEAEHIWGSLDGGSISTGSLTSGWFDLPELPSDQELAVTVAGRTGDGNRLAVEFGRSVGTGVRPLGQQVLDDAEEDPDEQPIYPTDHVMEDEPQDNPAWRDLPIKRPDVPAGADRIRVLARDRTTDSGGWLATTGPRIREVIPLTEYLRDKNPVLVDWSMTWSFPCVHDFPEVGGGLAEPPQMLITPPASFGFGGEAAYSRDIGGSFAGVRDTGTQREIPTRLLGMEDQPQHREWGHLWAVDYPLPANHYDVDSVHEPRWGWRGE